MLIKNPKFEISAVSKKQYPKGNYLVATLNNTVVASPRGLIAVLENNYQEDGTVKVPEVLWPYMGGTKVLVPKK